MIEMPSESERELRMFWMSVATFVSRLNSTSCVKKLIVISNSGLFKKLKTVLLLVYLTCVKQ